jgi:hypothetical protein
MNDFNRKLDYLLMQKWYSKYELLLNTKGYENLKYLSEIKAKHPFLSIHSINIAFCNENLNSSHLKSLEKLKILNLDIDPFLMKIIDLSSLK